MTQTKTAKAPWPEIKSKQPRQPIPRGKRRSRIDANFEEWAKRENVNLKDMKLMGKL